MVNHEIMNYDFNEATAFDGLMPKAAEIIGTIGESEVSVHVHGMEAKGVDALEVMDNEKAFE